MKKALICSAVLLLFMGAPLMAQYDHPDYLAIGFYGAAPLAPDNDLSFGFSLEHRLNIGLALMIDLEFHKSFYSYDDGQWQGPMNWNQVNSGGSKRSDWIFYQWDCLAAMLLQYYLPLPMERFTVAIGAGPTMVFILEAPSVDNYPEFEEYFSVREKEMNRLLGFQFRLAAEFRIWSFMYIGGGYRFKIRQLDGFSDEVESAGFASYLGNNSDIFLYLMVGF